MSDFINTNNLHNNGHKPASIYEYWWALAALLFIFWLFHPDLFMLRESPMFGDLWSNKDPTVSWSAYMPGLREFRYELFENGNIFWSPHRGLGQAILGNGVQGAPLFPLTLAQLWVPDQLFWSINPMSRIFITAVMLFLCARNLFNLPWVPAIVFSILAAYNINVFRWINHPWTNGLLAGAWYLYFMVQVTLPANYSGKRQAVHAIGLVLGVIGMVTNGFPEASAVFAFVVAFIYPAIVIARWSELKHHLSQSFIRLVLLHLCGFGLSIVQIIGLLEYIEYTQVMDLRDGISSNAFKPQDIAPYLNSQLSIFWRTDAQRDYISFTVGIIGGFLALQGLLSLVLDAKKHGRLIICVGVGFLLCMLMFVTKSFGLSSTVEWVFKHTPVLDVSHFPLYFPPMFFFGSAYFAALGIMAYGYKTNDGRAYHLLKLIWAVVSLGILIYAMKSVVNTFSLMGARDFWRMQFSNEGFNFVWFFLVISFSIIVFHTIHFLQLKSISKFLPSSFVAAIASIFALIGVTLEQQHTVKANFVDIDTHRLFRTTEEWKAIDNAVIKSGLPKHELRTRDESGDYIQTGLATIDNGASAMLPVELRLVRRALFDAPYGGYIPLRNAHFDWSGWLLSNNLTTIHSTTFSQPNWSDYQATQTLRPKHVRANTSFDLKRENPIFIADWVTSMSMPHATSVWAKFDDGKTVRWMLTNNGGKRANNIDGEIQTTNLWRIRLPIHELPAENYTLTLRVLDDINKQYQDSSPIPLLLTKKPSVLEKEGVLKTPKDSLLALYDNGSRSIYFEHNALPRAFVASSCVKHNNNEDSLALLKEGVPVLGGKIAINSGEGIYCNSYNNEYKRVGITLDGGSHLDFETVSGPALLFLNDSFYPGWTARDEKTGEELIIERANVAMRAVYLPEQKEYDISMTYKPSWLIWVKLISGVSGILLLVLLVKIMRNKNVYPD